METTTRWQAAMIAVKLTGVAVLAGAALEVLTTAPAHAAPPCAQFGTCQYRPNPNYDGPLLPTWDTPGTYGGWTNLPLMCDPAAYRCEQYVPVP